MIILMDCTFEYMQKIGMLSQEQMIELVTKNKAKKIDGNIQYMIIDDSQQQS